MGNQLVALSAAQFWSGRLINPIDYDENGNLVGTTEVWTGSTPNGTSTGFTASDWLSPIGPFSVATVGSDAASDGTWLDANVVNANLSLPIYAISQIPILP
jgi:hypothetical protein